MTDMRELKRQWYQAMDEAYREKRLGEARKPTRDDFTYIEPGSQWFVAPGGPEPVLSIQPDGSGGYEAHADWPSEKKSLRCFGKTMDEAKDHLLESLASPPPPNTLVSLGQPK